MKILNPLTVPRGDRRYQAKREQVSCTIAEAVGDPVYISGEKSGGILPVRKSFPSKSWTMPAFGLLESKSSDTRGVVVTFGLTDEIFSGIEINRQYYVSSGGVSLTEDSQCIGVGYSSTQIWVYPSSADAFDVDSIVTDDHTGLVLVDNNTGNVLVSRR